MSPTLNLNEQTSNTQQDPGLWLEFSHHHESGDVKISLTRSKTLNVSVTFPGDAAGKVFQQAWTCSAADAAKIQTALMSLNSSRNGQAKEYTLRVMREQQPASDFSWSAQEDVGALANARNVLERVAHLPYVKAAAYQQRAQALPTGKEAVEAWREGINALGKSYQSADIIDDTGMKLMLAEAKVKSGEFPMAAGMFQRILESRLHNYKRLHHLN